nr:epoxide hydrolase N-terminal domain-containing protein [Mycolicibacterium vanbaalenii]
MQRRLESARWPVEIDGRENDYGTDQTFLRSVIERWTSGYDWRATQAELNRWGSFTTTAAGRQVHLLHARSADPDAIPVVLTRGWPDRLGRVFVRDPADTTRLGGKALQTGAPHASAPRRALRRIRAARAVRRRSRRLRNGCSATEVCCAELTGTGLRKPLASRVAVAIRARPPIRSF